MQNHDELSPAARDHVRQAIARHRLPAHFASDVLNIYVPLVRRLYDDINEHTDTALIGIQGSQGSGKSTCADFLKILLESEYGLKVLVASIDDFYLTKSEREQLAAKIHPLFLTRGVPGTHDVDMIHAMFDAAQKPLQFKVPHFDKASDDRADESRWQQVQGEFDLVILEGWCVGLPAQNNERLERPVNELEALEDPQGQWRSYVNGALQTDYKVLFARLDILIALQAPSFDCVYGWRMLQEDKMIQRLQEQGRDVSGALSPAQLGRFIAHYQRLTEHALEIMPTYADYLVWLNQDHSMARMETYKDRERRS